jgi:hypothetical protein
MTEQVLVASCIKIMKTIVRGILAVIVGVIVGQAVNMALILLGPHIIPPPAGADMTTAEGLRASIHLLEPRHFIFPFLAHALGTCAGSTAAFLIAASHRSIYAYAIGVISLAGGVAAAFMFPAPTWFVVLDLVAAYIPMAWIATRLGRHKI